MIEFSIFISIGILAGLLGSLLGLGGGLILTPILTIVMGYDIKVAVLVSIFAVLGTSTGSALAYLEDDLLNLRLAMFLEIFTTIGAFVGALLSTVVQGQFLFILYGLLMFYQAYTMWKKIKGGETHHLTSTAVKNSTPLQESLSGTYYDLGRQTQVNYQAANIPLGSFIMFLAGVASALLGIGAGAFKVLAMDNVMGLPLKVSSATANFMMGVTGVSSAIFYFSQGSVDLQIVAPIVLGVIAGSTLGSKLMPRIPVAYLRVLFLMVLLVTGVQMFLRGLGG
ncbi:MULTISPECIES: sulfite exporter TauE/SafE family protein [unclassified Streptococcus]|uniref:sulfite exporter TauE/SafE family protein n=1 Tax=unclassified Streptococcus TaxID=2608887 RepID=UPI00107255DA|nr:MULTISPECIES: sulfite exporter TauE/SafE family protein [unclassified Streptococcus]MBF0805668.1 sulfite exporter TauE/SafE family protein [Streptococcus sp. 19428wA2_WM07]TFU28840.1 sulfite exporter TauE/SafE family protein [Streptococcus sp. WM07]